MKPTQQQIKTATDQQLAEWSVVHLKEWGLIEIPDNDSNDCYWVDEKGNFICWEQYLLKHWNPAQNIGQAMDLMKKLSDKYHWIIKTPFEIGKPCFVGLTLLGITGWNGRPDIEISVKNIEEISKGIVQAALMAVGA